MTPLPQPLDVRLNFPLRNIQSMRLAQAIMESGHTIHLDTDPHGQFAHLRKYFDVRCVFGSSTAPILPNVEINHAAPLTRLGRLERPLIFPHAIFDRVHATWPELRPVEFFFAGLLTPERERALRTWVQTAGLDITVPKAESKLAKWFREKVRRVDSPASEKVTAGGLTIWSSPRGREYPVKAWDEDYFQAMTRARCVLCPSGDFVWTYRFFEAALCGAIPVVEAACPAYEGFQFFTMQQPRAELRWSAAQAEHNFQLARERLTIRREELDAEIARLLAP